MRLELREVSLFFYGIILSTIIGIISFLFLWLEGKGAALLWSVVSPDNQFRLVYILGITLIGGVLVGSCRKKWPTLPMTAHEALAELKQTQTVDYRRAFPSLLVALIILVFGAGVGPEAGLLGAVVLLSVWQADKLRYYYFNFSQLKNISFVSRLKRLSHPLNSLSAYEAERSIRENKAFKKKLFYVLFTINGLLTFFILMKMVGQASFVTKMGLSAWKIKELWLLLPLILFGVLYGACFNELKKRMATKFTLWSEFPLRRALLGSFAIFIIGIFLPNLLFSGQLSLSLVPYVASDTSFILLTLIAIIKLLFLQICLMTGWIGGDIFPVVFAAIIQGFAVAQLLPQWDSLFIVAVVSVSIAIVILKSPLLVGVFVMLFFPLNLTPIILLMAVLFYIGNKYLTGLKALK